MCRSPNAAIYRECERKSSRSLVSSWTFAPRCAALLWPPGESHGAETRVSGMPGRVPVGTLKERRLLREGIQRNEDSNGRLEVVADRRAVLGREVEREILSRLRLDSEPPLWRTGDRVGQHVRSRDDVFEPVPALPVAPEHVLEVFRRGAPQPSQKELEPSLRLLPPHDHAMNSAVPDRRINGRRLWYGLSRPPIPVRGEPTSGRLRLLRVGRSVGDDPLELADRLVLQVEPGGADGEVVMEAQALGGPLEGGAEVVRRDRPLLSRDRLTRLGGVVDRGRRDLRCALAGDQQQREADRRLGEWSPHRPGIS